MDKIEFREMSLTDAEIIRQWRNQDIAAARTPYLLTKEMQEAWYRAVVCNRESRCRYWAIYRSRPNKMVALTGMAGLQSIEWENGTAEISLIIDPGARKRGYGKAALQKLLKMGFEQMRLHSVWGESYECNADHGFWEKAGSLYGKYLPDRKWQNGQWHSAYWFCWVDKLGTI